MSSKTVKVFWAIVEIYEPFRLSPPWNWYKYRIEAESCQIADYDCFIYYNPECGKWIIHEAKTGGCIAASETRERALGRAQYDIERTPDFKEQWHRLVDMVGKNHCNLPEKDTSEIIKRLFKDERDPDKEDLKDMTSTRMLEL